MRKGRDGVRAPSRPSPIHRVHRVKALFLGAEPIEADFAFEPLQALEQLRRAGFAEGAAGQPGEFIGKFARLEQAALDMSILDQARRNAETVIRNLMQTLGAKSVTVSRT